MLSLAMLLLVQDHGDHRAVNPADCRAGAELLNQLLPGMMRDDSWSRAQRRQFKQDRKTVDAVLARYPHEAVTPQAWRTAYQTPIDWTAAYLAKCASAPPVPAAE